MAVVISRMENGAAELRGLAVKNGDAAQGGRVLAIAMVLEVVAARMRLYLGTGRRTATDGARHSS